MNASTPLLTENRFLSIEDQREDLLALAAFETIRDHARRVFDEPDRTALPLLDVDLKRGVTVEFEIDLQAFEAALCTLRLPQRGLRRASTIFSDNNTKSNSRSPHNSKCILIVTPSSLRMTNSFDSLTCENEISLEVVRGDLPVLGFAIQVDFKVLEKLFTRFNGLRHWPSKSGTLISSHKRDETYKLSFFQENQILEIRVGDRSLLSLHAEHVEAPVALSRLQGPGQRFAPRTLETGLSHAQLAVHPEADIEASKWAFATQGSVTIMSVAAAIKYECGLLTTPNFAVSILHLTALRAVLRRVLPTCSFQRHGDKVTLSDGTFHCVFPAPDNPATDFEAFAERAIQNSHQFSVRSSELLLLCFQLATISTVKQRVKLSIECSDQEGVLKMSMRNDHGSGSGQLRVARDRYELTARSGVLDLEVLQRLISVVEADQISMHFGGKAILFEDRTESYRSRCLLPLWN